jgi:hypothetical protein
MNLSPMQKLSAFAETIVMVNYTEHPLYQTFLTEWEFKIEKQNKIVKELYLFDDNQNKIITHKFNEELQKKYFKFFEKIKLI